MANKNLDTTISLKAKDPINGILNLDTTLFQTVVYDDDNVTTGALTATTGAGGVKVIDASVSKMVYAYIKNTDATNFVILQTDAPVIFGRLLPGEWAFFPVAPSVGLEVRADTASVIVDTAVFYAP